VQKSEAYRRINELVDEVRPRPPVTCADCVEFDGIALQAMPGSEWCAKHTGSTWATEKAHRRRGREPVGDAYELAAGHDDQERRNVVRPAAFRKPVQGYAIEGARLNVSAGTGCAVDCSRCVGLDENGFVVIDGAARESAAEVHFCARHALAAEALVTFAGFRGGVIPQLLRILEQHEDNAIEASKLVLGPDDLIAASKLEPDPEES